MRKQYDGNLYRIFIENHKDHKKLKLEKATFYRNIYIYFQVTPYRGTHKDESN